MDKPTSESDDFVCKEAREKITGFSLVEEYFGLWPGFHDAEIIELHLHRGGSSWLRISVGPDGFRPAQKQGIVVFHFEEVFDLELCDFSKQNVIFAPRVETTDNGFKLFLSPCYGLAGWLEVSAIRVEVGPKDPI